MKTAITAPIIVLATEVKVLASTIRRQRSPRLRNPDQLRPGEPQAA